MIKVFKYVPCRHISVCKCMVKKLDCIIRLHTVHDRSLKKENH